MRRGGPRAVAGPGLPGRGLPGRGLPGRGLPGRGLPGRGLPGRGLPGRGARLSARARRLLAAALTAVAVAAGLQALAPPSAAEAPVLVAAHDLPAGHVPVAADVRSVGVPPDVVPDGALVTPGDLGGRPLAGTVRAGEPLTDVRLLGPALLDRLAADGGRGDAAGRGTGRVVVPVRVADAAVRDLVRVGDRVDLLAARAPLDADGQAVPVAREVARGALVLAVPAPAADELGLDPAEQGVVLVVAVGDGDARDLAAAALDARLSVVLRGQS